MNRPAHDHSSDIAALLADLQTGDTVRYLDLQRVESAAQALARWPLLSRIDAVLRADATPGTLA